MRSSSSQGCCSLAKKKDAQLKELCHVLKRMLQYDSTDVLPSVLDKIRRSRPPQLH